MEIEAWFLAEYSHFSRIHRRLTLERIEKELGFSPKSEDTQLRDHPAKDLEEIYFLEIINYHKTREHVERTVRSLDFSFIVNELTQRVTDLQNFVNTIHQFISG